MTPRQKIYVELAAAGFTQRDIAKLLGVTSSTVCKGLTRAGITSRNRAEPANKLRPDATALAEWGRRLQAREITRADIAKHFGVNLCTVWRWIPAVGAKPGVKPGSQGRAHEYIAKPQSLGEQRSARRRESEAQKRAELRAQLEAIR